MSAEATDSARAPTSVSTSIPRLPRWILVWMAISSTVVLWDVSFVLLRPMSMVGGSLAFIWIPYAKYVTVDHSYADLNNGFVSAQALMSLMEIGIVLAAMFAHRRDARGLATLLVFTASVLTCAKTGLILLMEAVTGLEHVGHNALTDLVLLYLVPNGIWIVMPLVVAWVTARKLLAGLRS